MPLEYQVIRKSFNAIATQYEQNAVLQKEVLSRLIERLSDESLIDPNLKPKRMLDLGCGTGWASSGLYKLFPQVELFALDFSDKMLKQIKNPQVVATQGDVHNLPYDDNCFDIVFSNMVLHWSNEQEVFSEARRVLKPGGLLVTSCLGETSLFELKQAFSLCDKNPHVHNFPALHNLGDDLLNKGFEQVVVNAEIITLTYQDIKALMHDIKASGGHNSDENRKKSLMATTCLEQVTQNYETYRQDGRLPASYEIIYMRAIKPKASGDINLSIQST
jgi:malonyl-CoA O-methyltransferase